MPAPIAFTPWHWAGFIAFVALFLALDLGVFHRQARLMGFKEALGWTALWVVLALLFAASLAWWDSRKNALGFLTGYFVELSLSMDNMFVIVLVFTCFRVAPVHQHRVLFWGILGALLMRGLMIWLGVELINRFQWLLYAFGAFLLASGARMLLQKESAPDPERSLVVRLARRTLPIAPHADGQSFFTTFNGRRMLTPLFLVLLMVETMDLLFAVDSIPAIFGVTRVPFIVFTSNVFAILGLRSLYFVLAGAIGLFRFLKVGLSLVLVFIGVKMLIDPHEHPPRWFQYDIPDLTSLLVIVGIIFISILVSVLAGPKESPPAAPAPAAR